MWYSILQPKGGRIKCSQLRSFLSHKKGFTAQKVYFIIAIMLWFLLNLNLKTKMGGQQYLSQNVIFTNQYVIQNIYIPFLIQQPESSLLSTALQAYWDSMVGKDHITTVDTYKSLGQCSQITVRGILAVNYNEGYLTGHQLEPEKPSRLLEQCS